MRWRLKLKLIVVLFSLICWLELVTAAPSPAQPTFTPKFKSFAAFTASYNSKNDFARGGVNGTVFFISPTRAITANHVLNKGSFNPLSGFERVKVWLVHENEPAIEIKAENLRSDPSRDLTIIDLPSVKKVADHYVFPVGTVGLQENVTSEGFVANTVGPTLKRDGADLAITEVRQLTRLHMTGQVIRQVQVNLKASDIDLKESPSIQLNYQPVVGISGGPVIAGGRVVGMNSFADPSTFKQTWALQLRPGIESLSANR